MVVDVIALAGVEVVLIRVAVENVDAAAGNNRPSPLRCRVIRPNIRIAIDVGMGVIPPRE
ncbi:MAG: hypothetical protein U1D30_13870 [Planctomycetota bacterium]